MTPVHYDADTMTRRELLGGALSTVAGLALLPAAAAHAQRASGDPYAPFKVGLQSYSLRHFGVDDALAKTQELGLHYWGGYSEHMPVTSDSATLSSYKAKLAAHNIRLLAYGVVDFSNDEADARRKFDFARAMNIPVLSAHPSPDSLGLLDRLVAEYNILIAVHNHGPDDALYGTWEKELPALEGHSPHIGICDDTGHYLMADDNPVTAALKFKGRLFDIHLKAVLVGSNGTKEFTELGHVGSLLDVVSLFRELQHQHYRHLIALEYEIHEEDPMPYIRDCLATVRQYCNTIRNVALTEPANTPQGP